MPSENSFGVSSIFKGRLTLVKSLKANGNKRFIESFLSNEIKGLAVDTKGIVSKPFYSIISMA